MVAMSLLCVVHVPALPMCTNASGDSVRLQPQDRIPFSSLIGSLVFVNASWNVDTEEACNNCLEEPSGISVRESSSDFEEEATRRLGVYSQIVVTMKSTAKAANTVRIERTAIIKTSCSPQRGGNQLMLFDDR